MLFGRSSIDRNQKSRSAPGSGEPGDARRPSGAERTWWPSASGTSVARRILLYTYILRVEMAKVLC